MENNIQIGDILRNSQSKDTWQVINTFSSFNSHFITVKRAGKTKVHRVDFILNNYTKEYSKNMEQDTIKVGSIYTNNRTNKDATVDSVLPQLVILTGNSSSGRNWKTTVTRVVFKNSYSLKPIIKNLIGKYYKSTTGRIINIIKETEGGVYFKENGVDTRKYVSKKMLDKWYKEIESPIIKEVEPELVKALIEAVDKSKSMTNIEPIDNVVNPPHYTTSKISALDVVNDWELDFYLGNALKYMKRYKLKGNPIQDLEKARQYLDLKIQLLKELENKNK